MVLGMEGLQHVKAVRFIRYSAPPRPAYHPHPPTCFLFSYSHIRTARSMHRPSPRSLFTPYPRSCHPISFFVSSYLSLQKSKISIRLSPSVLWTSSAVSTPNIVPPSPLSLSYQKTSIPHLSKNQPRSMSRHRCHKCRKYQPEPPNLCSILAKKETRKKNNLQNNLIPGHYAYCFRTPPLKIRTERRADAFPNPLLRKKHKTTQDPVMENIHNPIPANPNPSPPSSLKIPRGATAAIPHPWTSRA